MAIQLQVKHKPLYNLQPIDVAGSNSPAGGEKKKSWEETGSDK